MTDKLNGTTIIDVAAMNKDILVAIYDDGEKVTKIGGKTFWLPYDDAFSPDSIKRDAHTTHPGIRPRYGVVLATSAYAESMGVKIRDKVLLDTMKWSRGFKLEHLGIKCWRIKANDILLIVDSGFSEDEIDRINDKFPGVLV